MEKKNTSANSKNLPFPVPSTKLNTEHGELYHHLSGTSEKRKRNECVRLGFRGALRHPPLQLPRRRPSQADRLALQLYAELRRDLTVRRRSSFPRGLS